MAQTVSERFNGWTDAAAPAAARRESRLRLGVGALIGYGILQALVGVIWDIQWHIDVGRDRFLTPPHLMLYTGITLAGLTALAFGLAETVRYRHGAPGVDEGSTTPWLRLFHAPLGIIVVGCGALATLAAAPLDNYWHILYGIDVTLWGPFHVMGLVGGAVICFGLVYLFASERNRYAKRRERGRHVFVLFCGSLAVLYAMLMLIASAPAFEEMWMRLGNWPVWPLLAAFATSFCLLAGVRFAGLGGAVGAALGFTAIRLGAGLFTPWATHYVAQAQGMPFRGGAIEFAVVPASFPKWLIVWALAVEGLYWLTATGRLKLRVAAPLGGAAAALLVGAFEHAWNWAYIEAGLNWQAALLAELPVVAVIGAAGGALGAGFGFLLKVSDR